jgi:hypothetical protein
MWCWHISRVSPRNVTLLNIDRLLLSRFESLNKTIVKQLHADLLSSHRRLHL